MTLTKTSLAMIAVAGALAFSPTSRAQTNASAAGGKNARGRANQQLTQLAKQLNLTDDQKPRVRAVFEEQRKKTQELRADTAVSPKDLRAKRQALTQDTNKKMKEILTADQFKKYEEWQQQQRGRGAGGQNRKSNGAKTANGGDGAGNGAKPSDTQ